MIPSPKPHLRTGSDDYYRKAASLALALPKPDTELIELRLRRAQTPDAGLKTVSEMPLHEGSGNVFVDIGFTPAEAAELIVKSNLISAIGDTIKWRKLTQQETAQLCTTDQPTLSKVLRGRMESVSIDRLALWLTALGRTVEIHVQPFDANTTIGQLVAVP